MRTVIATEAFPKWTPADTRYCSEHFNKRNPSLVQRLLAIETPIKAGVLRPYCDWPGCRRLAELVLVRDS